jgi:hypothetical protein
VGGASRMQELVIDLLAISRFEQLPGNPDATRPQAGNSPQVSGALQFAVISPVTEMAGKPSSEPLAPAP